MAKSGLNHIDVGPELTKTEWESEESHEVVHGTSFPSSPVERQLFYRDDEHKWYIYNGTDWVWLGGGSGGGGMEVHGNEYHDPDFATESALSSHANLTNPHSATSAATADRLILRDASGRAKVAVPSASDDVAIKSTVDDHALATTGVHSFNKTCRLWHNATQSIPNASATPVYFNTEKWDTDDMHSLVSNTHLVTCVTAGKYLVAGLVEFAANSTGNRQLYIYLNGTILQNYAINWLPPSGNVCCLSTFCFVDMAVTDTLQLKVYQNSGGSLNLATVDPYSPMFTVTRIV